MPADAGIAIGPDEAVQSENVMFRFTDRSGLNINNLLMQQLFLLPETFGFITFDSDPRIHFDALRQRWIATEMSWDCFTAFAGDTAAFGHGNLDFAISDTADPLSTWSAATFQYDDLVPMEPNFGTSTDKLGLTATLFHMKAGGGASNPSCTGGSFLESDVFAMDWSQLGPKYNSAKVITFGQAFGALDLRLAVQDPVTSPDLRLVNSFDDTIGGGTTTDVVTLDFSGSASKKTIVINGFDLTEDGVLPQFLDAPAPNQPGGTLTPTIATVPDSVVFRGGTFAFTATYPCKPAGDSTIRDCIRVATLATTTAAAEPTRLGDTLLGSNGFDNTFGAIAWSGSGVLHAVYTRSSATSDASSVDQYNLPSDTPVQWSAPHVLSAGSGSYSNIQPWGLYSLISQDPQDPTAIWAGDAFSDTGHGWSTSIHEIVVGGAGAGYFPIAPIRVLDSRDGTGLIGHTPSVFTANVPKKFPVAGVTINSETIPTDAVAITGNLTVTGQTGAGYISLTPMPTTTPSTSTLNSPLGDTRANNVTIALGPDGSLAAVYKEVAGKHANVLLDVTGYFRTGAGQTYFPLASIRILDSRDGTGQPGHIRAVFHANIAQSFPVQNVTVNSETIPADATAITANLTVTGQTKAGYVSLTPTLDNNPGTSTINVPLGDTRANGLTIQVGSDGTVSAVYKAASGSANLILDVTGYYRATGTGLLFHPLSPGRLIDTRQLLGGVGAGNQLTGAQGTAPRPAVTAGHFAIPAGAAAITGNLTVTGQTAAGYVSVTDASVANPLTSTINFPLGDTRANGITAPLGSGNLWFDYQPKVGKTVHLILDITGYFQ